MLGFLKRFWDSVVNAMGKVDAIFFDSPEECRKKHEELWIEILKEKESQAGQKRRRGADLESEAGSSQKKPSSTVQSNAPVPPTAHAPTPSSQRVDARHDQGAATNAAATPPSLCSAASDVPHGVLVEQAYQGDTLMSLPLSKEHAELVYCETPTVMFQVDPENCHIGHLQCRKARNRPQIGWTFLMNFNSTEDSSTVELEHWFSIEDLAYMHDLAFRSNLSKETKHFGILKPVPVAQ